MFGRSGDFWTGLPMEPAPPAYPSPSPPDPVHFLQYRLAFTPPTPVPAEAWTVAENRVFEAALVDFEEGRSDQWKRIAERIPGKTPWDVAEHYRRLVDDLRGIEAGIIALPDYEDDCLARKPSAAMDLRGGGADEQQHQRRISFGGSTAKPEERKKGFAWTTEEHSRFLEGLEKYGKGDWRSISRNSVVTRTPSQVASHAQKYFIRLSGAGKKERRRSSIHDVTRP